MGKQDGKEERMGNYPPPIFIALKSPGLTEGLAASRVGLRTPGRACRGTLRAATAGQAGEYTGVSMRGDLNLVPSSGPSDLEGFGASPGRHLLSERSGLVPSSVIIMLIM